MKAIKISILLLLTAIGNRALSQASSNLANEIINSETCVVGHVVAADTVFLRFKIDHIVQGTFAADTICLIKNLHKFDDSTVSNSKDSLVIFPDRVRGSDSIWIFPQTYFRVANNTIQLNDCSIGLLLFKQSIADYSQAKATIIFNLQIGKKNATTIRHFRKKSAIHQAIYDELYDLHYQGRITQSQAIVIAPLRMNTLYVGLENPLEIAIPPHFLKRYYLTTNNGRIKYNNGYSIFVQKDTATNICIYDWHDTSKALFCQQFRTKLPPDATAMIFGKHGGKIPKNALLAAKRIDARLVNYDIDIDFIVESFIIIIKDGCKEYVLKSFGCKLPNSFKALIPELNSNTSIFFCNIMYKAADGKIREAAPLEFKLE